MDDSQQTYTAFNGNQLLAQGALDKVVLKVKKQLQVDPLSSVFIFSDITGKEIDFDLRGSENAVLERLKKFVTVDKIEPSAGPGRPKLGVISREISLLPRHWEWLSIQPGGASVTLRRLIDETRKTSTGREQIKFSQDRTYKFMTTMAGNFPNYEEALRALFAKDKKTFEQFILDWPKDIKKHTLKLAADVFTKNWAFLVLMAFQ